MLARLFLFTLLISDIEYCTAQNCLDDVLSNKIYSTADDIINGRKWIYEKKYIGTPLLMSVYWPVADIIYNGSNIPGQKMNYDIYKDEMIVSRSVNDRIIYVVINKNNLTGFSFTDSADMKFRRFEYTELPGIGGRSLYENLSEGRVRFYIKPLKTVEMRSTGGTRRQYTEYFEYYLPDGDQFVRISNKNQILRLWPDHEAAIKEYMHVRRFKINTKNTEEMIDLVRFLGNLK